MKRFVLLCALAAGALLPAGCDSRSQPENAQETVMLFQKNRGLRVPEEVCHSLGVELAEISEKRLLHKWSKTARVFRPGRSNELAAASVLLRRDEARALSPGQTFDLSAGEEGGSLSARLVRLDHELENALGQIEAIIEFSDRDGRHRLGSILTAHFESKTAETLAIPESAIIEGAESCFVYVESGEHLLRTSVKIGAVTDGWAEVTDGLVAGDKVAVNASKDLWLIELMALRGGSPCCSVPKKRAKE